MQQPIKIYIIAGEPSGDIYGASLIQALTKISGRQIDFYGIGGERMIQKGIKSLFPMAEISIMGFWEIIPHIPNTINRINQCVDEIKKIQPHIVITIDSPGFCCRVAKKLRGSGIKLLHYVAPTVWAYKPKRAEKFAKLFDHLLVILPFEPPYFNKVGLANTFIGHPIVETNIKKWKGTIFRNKHKISDDDLLLCVMPGSRSTEVSGLLPIFLEAIEKLSSDMDNLKIVIPTIPALVTKVKRILKNYSVKAIVIENVEDKYSAYSASNAALVKSGTGTMELSLAKCPMVIAYKISTISYWIIKSMIKVKYANLINLILDKEVIPELIQNDCTSDKIVEQLLIILQDKNNLQAQESEIVLKQLGLGEKKTPSEKAAEVVMEVLHA